MYIYIFVHVTFPVSLSNIFFFSSALKNYYFNVVFCGDAPFSDKKMFCTPECVMRSTAVTLPL